MIKVSIPSDGVSVNGTCDPARLELKWKGFDFSILFAKVSQQCSMYNVLIH